MKKKGIIRIVIFYTMGITLSNLFRFELLELNLSENLTITRMLITSPLGAIGLLIGALIAMYFLRQEREQSYSLFGTSIKWSIIMMVIPVVLLSILGVENEMDVNVYLYGAVVGISAIIYAFTEEIGWRGYLQDELKNIKEWQRVILIGFLWYLWHLSFLTNQNIMDNLQFLGWMIFGSWGIGKVIDSTKSIISATCFHVIINIIMFNPYLKNGISGSSKLIVLGLSIVLWIIILNLWKKEKETNEITTETR